MKKMVILFFAFFVATVVLAQVPKTISFQGYLTDASGNPVTTGNYKFKFDLFENNTGSGTAIWSETHASVAVKDGQYNVLLGSETVDGLNVSFNKPYFLKIEFNNQPFSELIPLSSSPYSLSLVDASKITSGTINNARLDDDLQDLADGSLSGSKLGIVAGSNIIISPSSNNTISISTGGSALSGTGSAGQVAFWSSAGSFSSSNNLVWDNTNGNLGIGLTNPAQKLDVNGTVKATSFSGTLAASNISGSLSVAQGGTGATTLSGLLIGNGTAAITGLTGTASQYLRRNSANTAFEFATLSKSDVGLSNVENTALSTFAGSGNITTVGTLSSGTVPWARLSGVPSSFTPAAHTLDGHSNVTISSIASGEILKWNGSAWVNNTLSEAGIQPTDTDLDDLADGSLTGSKVGSGIDASNITAGTLPVARISDGSLTDAKLATISTAGKVSGSAITSGTIGGSTVIGTTGNLTTSGYVGTTNGLHVGNTTAPASGNLEVDGYAKLGATAPAIRMLKLTGITNSSAAASTNINHGLTVSKILSVSVMVEYATDNFVTSDFNNSYGYHFNWSLTPTQVVVTNVDKAVSGFAGVYPSLSSQNIRSANIKILIIYEQ